MVFVMKFFFDIRLLLWIGALYIDVPKAELRQLLRRPTALNDIFRTYPPMNTAFYRIH